MDECLVKRGFETTEEFAVLANIATSSPTLERAGFRVVATERRHVLEVS